MEIVITQILELETGTDIHTEGGGHPREKTTDPTATVLPITYLPISQSPSLA